MRLGYELQIESASILQENVLSCSFQVNLWSGLFILSTLHVLHMFTSVSHLTLNEF